MRTARQQKSSGVPEPKSYKPPGRKSATDKKYESVRGEKLNTRGHGSLDELERKLAGLGG